MRAPPPFSAAAQIVPSPAQLAPRARLGDAFRMQCLVGRGTVASATHGAVLRAFLLYIDIGRFSSNWALMRNGRRHYKTTTNALNALKKQRGMEKGARTRTRTNTPYLVDLDTYCIVCSRMHATLSGTAFGQVHIINEKTKN